MQNLKEIWMKPEFKKKVTKILDKIDEIFTPQIRTDDTVKSLIHKELIYQASHNSYSLFDCHGI